MFISLHLYLKKKPLDGRRFSFKTASFSAIVILIFITPCTLHHLRCTWHTIQNVYKDVHPVKLNQLRPMFHIINSSSLIFQNLFRMNANHQFLPVTKRFLLRHTYASINKGKSYGKGNLRNSADSNNTAKFALFLWAPRILYSWCWNVFFRFLEIFC